MVAVAVSLAAAAALSLALVFMYSGYGEVRADTEHMHDVHRGWGQVAARIPTAILRAVTLDDGGEDERLIGLPDLTRTYGRQIRELAERPWLGRLIDTNPGIGGSFDSMFAAWIRLEHELDTLTSVAPEDIRYARLVPAGEAARDFSTHLRVFSLRVESASDAHTMWITRLEWSLIAVLVLLVVAAAVQAHSVVVRSRADERVRSVVRSELVGRDRERTRMAALLREDVAQALAAVRLSLSQRSLCGQRECATADDNLGEALSRIKDAAASLDSVAVFDTGLAPSLEHACRRLAARERVDIDVVQDAGEAPGLSEDAVVGLVRVVLLVLEMLIVHAAANRLVVAYLRRGDEEVITVHDNGGPLPRPRGTDPLAETVAELDERALAIGASVELKRRPQGRGDAAGWAPRRIEIAYQPSRREDAAYV